MAAVLLTMSCGTSPVTSAGTSGTALVSGVVRVTPACPADPVHGACRPRPLAGIRVQADSAGARVATSSVTGADGRYTVHVHAGRYVLRAPGSLRCHPATVTVPPGATVRADLSCAASPVPVPPDSA